MFGLELLGLYPACNPKLSKRFCVKPKNKWRAAFGKIESKPLPDGPKNSKPKWARPLMRIGLSWQKSARIPNWMGQRSRKFWSLHHWM